MPADVNAPEIQPLPPIEPPAKVSKPPTDADEGIQSYTLPPKTNESRGTSGLTLSEQKLTKIMDDAKIARLAKAEARAAIKQAKLDKIAGIVHETSGITPPVTSDGETGKTGGTTENGGSNTGTPEQNEGDVSDNWEPQYQGENNKQNQGDPDPNGAKGKNSHQDNPDPHEDPVPDPDYGQNSPVNGSSPTTPATGGPGFQIYLPAIFKNFKSTADEVIDSAKTGVERFLVKVVRRRRTPVSPDQTSSGYPNLPVLGQNNSDNRSPEPKFARNPEEDLPRVLEPVHSDIERQNIKDRSDAELGRIRSQGRLDQRNQHGRSYPGRH